MSSNEVRRGKTALRADVKAGMIAKCIQMHGESYAETSHWHRLTKVGTDSVVLDGHRELNIRGKKIVYCTYTSSPGRFLKVYDSDGSLSALYALRANERRG